MRPAFVMLAVTVISGGCAIEGASSTAGPGGKADDLEQERDRPGWVVEQIEAWNAGLSDADRAAKYCKMAASPFGFYRGTNHLYWADFAGDPRLETFGNRDTRVWLQGDLHPQNFGSFFNDRGALVFGINDFDESMVADYQYDLWRMAAGATLGVELEAGLTREQSAKIIDTFVEAYLDAMDDFHGNGDEMALDITTGNASPVVVDFLEEVFEKKTREAMLETWTTLELEGRRLDTGSPKLEPVTDAERDEIVAAMAEYRRTLSGGIADDPDYFQVLDVARRLDAGTGSLGTPRYYLLIDGPTTDPDDDVILDVKEQSSPTPYHFLAAERAEYDRHFDDDALRHRVAVKALGVRVDDHLGEMHIFEGSYSVRERSPGKDDIALDKLDREEITGLAGDWGLALAANHARADRDFDPTYIDNSVDAAIDNATEGDHAKVRALVREIGGSYADQVMDDYDVFLAELAPDCDEP